MASADIDVCEETAECRNSSGDEAMDISSDDEFAPDDEEVCAEMSQESLLKTNSCKWDRFLGWTSAIETPWAKDDTTLYRKFRALEYCNHARGCARDLLYENSVVAILSKRSVAYLCAPNSCTGQRMRHICSARMPHS